MKTSRSSGDHTLAFKSFMEQSIKSRYAEFQEKYSQKQVLNNEKRCATEVKLKERLIKAQIRQSEAALKRKLIEEKKRNKILERRSKSESREGKSEHSMELRPSSKPGVFINISKGDICGTAGFGRGYEKRPETYVNIKSGMSFFNTSINKRIIQRRPPATSQTITIRNPDQSETLASSNISKIKTFEVTPTSMISNTLESYDDDTLKTENTIVWVPKLEQKISFDKGNLYRSLRRKRITCNIFQKEPTFEKPTIKKPLIIQTPETKKGILMKMSALSSKLIYNDHQKYEPGMLPKITLPNVGHRQIDLEGRGDELQRTIIADDRSLHISEATNTEPTRNTYPINSITTSFRIEDIYDEPGCKTLLETCERDRKSRKLKLAQLHKDLMAILRETKIWTDKNAEVRMKIIAKSQSCKKEESQKKVSANSHQSGFITLRPRVSKDGNVFLTDGLFRRYGQKNNSYKELAIQVRTPSVGKCVYICSADQ